MQHKDTMSALKFIEYDRKDYFDDRALLQQRASLKEKVFDKSSP